MPKKRENGASTNEVDVLRTLLNTPPDPRVTKKPKKAKKKKAGK